MQGADASGMTMVEVIFSMILLMSLVGSVWVYLGQNSQLQGNLVASANEQIRETILQEAVLLGGPFRHEEDIRSSSVRSRNPYPIDYPDVFWMKNGEISGGIVHQQQTVGVYPREDRLGIYFHPQTKRMETGKQQLAPPEVLYDGEMLASWFPLHALLQKPEANPQDTYYRYRWDDGSPGKQSLLWDFSRSLQPEDMYPALSVQALHSDPYYLPSNPVTIHFQLAAPSVRYSRSDGSDSTWFSPSDLEGGGNPLVLSIETDFPGLWEIRYTLDGSEPSPASPIYTGPLTPQLNEGTPLRARAISINGRFPAGEELRLMLYPSHAKLTVIQEIVGDYPFSAPSDWPENRLNYDVGEHEVDWGEEVLLIAEPGHGYWVEWHGVDRSEENRAWVKMEGARSVRVLFRLGTSVVIYDEQNQMREQDRFRYRMVGEEGWSSWKHTPEVVILPTGNDVWEFEIEDRSDAGEYRSLFHVRNYMQTEQVAPLVALFSRYPMPRKIWKTRGEHWWDVGTDAPERVYVEMIGGGAAGGAGWISRGSHWDGASGKLIPFQIRLQAGGGGGSGELRKGILFVHREHPVQIQVGSGGQPSNEYELKFDGTGYRVLDDSPYQAEGGEMQIRHSSVQSYPKIGAGGASVVASMDWLLEAPGGGVARNMDYAKGNMVGYVHGGHGGFGGGGGTIVEGGNEIQGMVGPASGLHPEGGQSRSKGHQFYPFSVLEFAEAGMSGAPMWWLSNVYDSRYDRKGGKGGSGIHVARDEQHGQYPAVLDGSAGTWVSLYWLIQMIPSPDWINQIYRYSPAREYTSLYSMAHQQQATTLLDFVHAGGGGGGIQFKQEYVDEFPGANSMEYAAERGWYASTWANVYASQGPRGIYNTAGERGYGFGGGGGGASSPWSHPTTWNGGSGVLGHFLMQPPSLSLRNPLLSLPGRGRYSQVGVGIQMPTNQASNAPGMIGPSGGRGADGLVIIYY